MNAPNFPHRTTQDYQRSDAAHHLHAFVDQKALNEEGARVMVRGEGVHLWDNDGNRYLDGMSGCGAPTSAMGGRSWSTPRAADEGTVLLQHVLSYDAPVGDRTVGAAVRAARQSLQSRGVYHPGSESNEVLIRTVRRFWDVMGKPQKKVLIGRVNGYHGSTVGSASLGGMAFMHEMGDLPIPNITHVDEPYWYANGGDLAEAFGKQAALSLERKILEIGADRVAAFVAEPFQGAGGMIFPPDGYWQEIERICRQYDVLLCADEVIGGFGRTGEWFAHRHFGFEPDLICMARA